MPSLTAILQTTTDQIDEESQTLMVDGCEVTISSGLHGFLCCLLGEGEGAQKRRLFSNVSLKMIEREVAEASTMLLGDGVEPILPAAFLISPHLFSGQRMPRGQRERMRKIEPVVPFSHTRHQVLAALKASHSI